MIILLAIFNFAFRFEGIGNERFTVYFPEGYQDEARLTLSYLEQYYRHADQITGNRPGRLTVVIEDIGTESNGFTDPVAAAIHLYANVPYPDFRFGAGRSWWRTVSLHEYTHYSHLANVRGLVRYLRYPLGKVWLPNTISALYMYEGVTVLSESSILPYEGRLNEGYFDAYENLSAAEGRLPSQNNLAHVPDDYPGGEAPYLFGGEFTRFLSRQKTGVGSGPSAREDFYAPLARYYNHYAGCCLLDVLGYDYSAKKVWGRSRSELFRVWQKQAARDAHYERIPGRRLLDGYALTYPAAAGPGIYVGRQASRPLAYDYTDNHSELRLVDPATGRSKRILSGTVSLPIRIEGEDVYAAVGDLRPNAKNYSLYGYGSVSTILRIRNGKIKKLFTGEIKAFAVRDGVLYYARKKGSGSVIYADRAEYITLDRLLVQDMAFRDNGDLVFIGYQEADGNNLYLLSADRSLRQLTDQDFSFSGLSVVDDDVYFSANCAGSWRPYRLDLETGEVYRLLSDGLAAYPFLFQEKLYYITIEPAAEVLKEVSVEEEPAAWSERREKVSLPPSAAYTQKSVWENGLSLFWPDLSLPFYLPAMDSQPAAAGLIMVGHDALGVHDYNLFLTYDSTVHYDAAWNYQVFPPLSATLRLSDKSDAVSGLFDLLCWLRNSGSLRSISLSSVFYPFTKDIDGLLGVRLKPWAQTRLDLYAAGFFTLDPDRGMAGRVGLTFYLPFWYGVLVPRFQAGYAAESMAVRLPSGAEAVGIYGVKASLRFTMPILAPKWGIDFPHLFIERIWGSIETQAGAAVDDFFGRPASTRYNYLVYATLNMSVLNGFLKFRPSLGAVFDPDERDKITPYLSVTMDLLNLLDRMESRRRMARSIDRFPETEFR